RNLEIVDASTFHLTELTSMKCSAIDKNFEYNVRQFTYGCMHKQAVDGVLEITNFHGQCEFNDLGSRYYSVDGKVYFSEKRLYEADADTFEVISVQYNRHTYRYAKDSRSVYFMARKLKNADPKTFQIIPTSPYYSFDRERRYSQGNNIADFGPSFARSENEKFEEAFVKWKSGAETNLTSETCTSSRKRRSGLSGRRANGLEDSSRLG
ncbi:MAG TPA: hypothetical protein DEP46_15855, partial [Blastocatellia bacterium]|nr:hypothetical protein [Blastocatellia bacterium]